MDEWDFTASLCGPVKLMHWPALDAPPARWPARRLGAARLPSGGGVAAAPLRCDCRRA